MTCSGLAVVLLFLGCPAAAQEDGYGTAETLFRLTERKEGGRVTLVGTNLNPHAPCHVVVSFPRLVNYRASMDLPARVVLPPASTADLFFVEIVNGKAGASYGVECVSGFGDPRAAPDLSHRYLLPFEHGTKRVVGQGYLGSFTHRDSYALDFNMPEGTVICAARDGVVTRTKDDSSEGGLGPEYNDKANYVEVLHEDGSWATYAHLKTGGAKVAPGGRVRAGEAIGLSGNTGRSAGPHLHFAVNRATWGGSETFPTAFLGKDGSSVSVKEDRWYYSHHPGGEAFEEVLGEKLVEADLERHRAEVAVTGEVSFRSEQIDDRTIIYCRNATDREQVVRVGFRKLAGFDSSKRVPRDIAVPAATEVYVLMLTRKPGAARALYELSASARARVKGR